MKNIKLFHLLLIPFFVLGCNKNEQNEQIDEKSIVKLTTPNLYTSDDLLFWDNVGSAFSYEIYKDDALLDEVDTPSYLMLEEGFYSVKAIPNKSLTDSRFVQSDISEKIEYKIHSASEEMIIDVNDHNKDELKIRTIPNSINYVIVRSTSTDDLNKFVLYNDVFEIVERENKLTIDFENNFREIYVENESFITYLGNNDEMPLLSLNFSSDINVKAGSIVRPASNGEDENINPPTDGENGIDAKSIANLNNLLIRHSGNITLSGGDGQNGGNGGNAISLINPGSGGNGGKGAPSFEISNYIYSYCPTGDKLFSLYSGKGGLGGLKGKSSINEAINTATNGKNGKDSDNIVGKYYKIK